MTAAFDALPVEALRALADALETGALVPDYTPLKLGRYVPTPLALAGAAGLAALAGPDVGMSPRQLAATLRLLHRERAARRSARDDIEVVWTGPESDGAGSRDTKVVVRELFEQAEQSVLVASYRIHQGRQVLGPLASRMAVRPALSVRFFLHVDPPAPGRTEAHRLAVFADEFRAEWPGVRLPEVYYLPQTLAQGSRGAGRVSLHAKILVVDGRRVLVTSANFTEAAQERNIEAGILLTDAGLGQALTGQFHDLVTAGGFQRVPGLV